MAHYQYAFPTELIGHARFHARQLHSIRQSPSVNGEKPTVVIIYWPHQHAHTQSEQKRNEFPFSHNKIWYHINKSHFFFSDHFLTPLFEVKYLELFDFDKIVWFLATDFQPLCEYSRQWLRELLPFSFYLLVTVFLKLKTVVEAQFLFSPFSFLFDSSWLLWAFDDPYSVCVCVWYIAEHSCSEKLCV